MLKSVGTFLIVSLIATFAFADGPADNLPGNVRRIPKLGIEVPAEQREALEGQLAALSDAIDELRKREDPWTREVLPDVRIYYKAVHDALKYQEFFREEEIEGAFNLLQEGMERAGQLADGKAPWTKATGLVVRGYVSKIDHSVQPYGLVIPESYTAEGAHRHRVDVWFHGRGETLSETAFLLRRSSRVGEFAPADTIVLHPYGRYSNAFKFAGETDVLEALDSVRSRYRVDEDRISVRGFSMGGAACWQFAVHYADRWFAANPGAGFSETPQFLRIFQNEDVNPTWYQKKLWHLYDCDDWAINLYHCPTVAYSGELDKQKQAADVMAAALAELGMDLVHVIGADAHHHYVPEAKRTVERRLGSIAEKGRQRLPRTVFFTTYTLKYNRMHWVTVDGLGEHWEAARIGAQIQDDSTIMVRTDNVTALTLDMPAGWAPLDITNPVEISIDGQTLRGPRPSSDRSWKVRLHRADGAWRIGGPPADGLHKRHNLQGPIDDAFMDSFIFVRPTGESSHAAVNEWVDSEMDRAVEHWRRHFRGEARVKDDSQITEEDIASANLVLWGDPSSNAVLRKIADQLPIQWGTERITVGDRTFPADHHAVIMIYPNPLNPERYIVLNSSFTFREYAYLNNARQVPKLPDWAVVDLRTPPDSRGPGEIADADFFNEQWQLRPAR